MIKNRLKAILVLAILATVPLMAENSYEFQTKSLIGIEGGYSSLDSHKNNQAINSIGLANLGIKIGAETEDFRVFLSGRYFYDPSAEYEYLVTYGAEIQYKFNVSKAFNIYLGANGGYSSMRFDPANDGFGPRSLSAPYFGGDIGTNIHLNDATDFEIGGRVMSIQATHTSSTYGDYHIGNIVNVYASLIFKWKMD